MLEPAHAALVARAARLDALADPDLLLRQQLVEFLVVHGLDGQLLGLALLVLRVGPRVQAEPAAVEFGNAGDDAIQKGAIVRDDEHCAGIFDQHVLQPDDRIHVQVVGRFVEDQQPRIAREGARQCNALAQAPRQRVDARIQRQAQAREHGFDPVLDAPAIVFFEQLLGGLHAVHDFLIRGRAFEVMHRRVVIGQDAGKIAQAGDGGFEDGVSRFEFGLLRDDTDAQARLPPDAPVIGLRPARQQPEQARFARAIATDQPDAAARLHHQVHVVEQRHMPIGERDVFESGERHGELP